MTNTAHQALNEKYAPETPKEMRPDYTGQDNQGLDRDLCEWEVRAAMQKLNTKSAAGPDRITNKDIKTSMMQQ